MDVMFAMLHSPKNGATVSFDRIPCPDQPCIADTIKTISWTQSLLEVRAVDMYIIRTIVIIAIIIDIMIIIIYIHIILHTTYLCIYILGMHMYGRALVYVL